MNFPSNVVFCILVALSVQFVFALQPLEVSVISQAISFSKKELLKVQVTDINNKFASKAKVVLIKAFPTDEEESILASNKEFTAVEGDQTAYQLDFLALKPDVGAYTLELKVVPTDKKFATIDSVDVQIKVIGAITVSDATLIISDSEDSHDVAGKKYKPAFGKKLGDVLKLQDNQHLFLEFKVKGQTRPNIQIHQSFVRLTHPKSGREVFVISQATPTGYSAHLSMKDMITEFYSESGSYELQLIIGDTSIENPSTWTVASLEIKFPNNTGIEPVRSPFDPQPEIIHQFRLPEPRPPKKISMAFTLLTLGVPFVVLFIGLIQVGANFGNFPTGSNFIFAIGFQVCLGSILGLFVFYWLKLNMMQTLGYLAILAIPSLFFAHRNLNSLSATKEHTE